MKQEAALASKLTTKYQATIPEKVRKLLGLKGGDVIGFTLRKKAVTIKKLSPVDFKFAKSLESTLSEWNSEHDEEAYRDL